MVVAWLIEMAQVSLRDYKRGEKCHLPTNSRKKKIFT